MSSGSLIVLKKNGSEGSRFPIEEDNIYKLGPRIGCHLRFNVHKDVKTDVCTISTKKAGNAKIKKMSSFPIQLNNREITSPKNLKSGDVIKIGPKMFRWDSEIKPSEITSLSAQKKMPGSHIKRLPCAAIRGYQRSSAMKTRKSATVDNLSTWEETNENIVSSKAETDVVHFTVSNSPAKPSQTADSTPLGNKQQQIKLRSSTYSAETTTDKRTPKLTVKPKSHSKIPIARENIPATAHIDIVKTPVVVCAPLITPNIKAMKSARKKSASLSKSSDNMMSAKKWKISDITDDNFKCTTPDLIGAKKNTSEKENDLDVSSVEVSTSHSASFNKQEGTPKLRTASVNKKFITNKSHTDLKKINKKVRRGSLPTEPEIDSPVINKLTTSAKTVGKVDLSTISQCESSVRKYLHNRNNQSQSNLATTSSGEENLFNDSSSVRRSMRNEQSVTSIQTESARRKSESNKNEHSQSVPPPSRRSLRMGNRLSSLQVNTPENKNNHQTFTSPSESPLTKSERKESHNSSTKKSAYKANLSQSNLRNLSPKREQNFFTSSVKKSTDNNASINLRSENAGSRKSLRQGKQLLDISQPELSFNKSVPSEINLLDISLPVVSNSNTSMRTENIFNISQPTIPLRKSHRKQIKLLATTVSNTSVRRSSRRKSSHLVNISQNMSGVGFLTEDNDLIDWESSDCELENLFSVSKSMKHADNENGELIEFKEENNSSLVTSAKKQDVQKSTLNDSSDVKGVKVSTRKSKTLKNDLANVLDPKDPKSPANDLTNVAGDKALMKTADRQVKTPKNDLTDVRGVKRLLDPKDSKSPKNDLTNVSGVKALLKTPGRKAKTPKNDVTYVRGVKRLLNPLKRPNSPVNDLSEVPGVKKLFTLPKVQNSPINDLTDVRGVKKLLKTPRRVQNSPKNDLSDVRGIKRLMNPRKGQKSPANDLTKIDGVKSLFRSPKVQNSPNNDLSDVKGVKMLLKTPGRKQKSPKNDLSDVRGVKQLLAPKLRKSPVNDLTDVRGVKQIFKRNNLPRNDLSDVEGVTNLFESPEKFKESVDEEEEAEIKTARFNSADDLFDELKHANEPIDSPLSHLRKSPIKTYERKAVSLSPIKREAKHLKLKNRYSERVVLGSATHVQKWIDEQKALSSKSNITRKHQQLIPVAVMLEMPRVSGTESKPINQRVLKTMVKDDDGNTADVELTPGTRTRRQQIKVAGDAGKTESPVTRNRSKELLTDDGITDIVNVDSVSTQDVAPRSRGRPKASAKNVDAESVPTTKARRGRPKKVTEEANVVEEVVVIQKTTRKFRNNDKTIVVSETVEVLEDNSMDHIDILATLGVTENATKKSMRKRSKAKTESDAESARKVSDETELEQSRHVQFKVSTLVEPKRGKRVAKKTGNEEEEEIKEQQPIKRGRSTRKKVSEQNELIAETGVNKEEEVPETMYTEHEANRPVKRGRNTRRKVQDDSEEKVAETKETQPALKRGRNTRKIDVKESEADDESEEIVTKLRRKQPTKITVIQNNENDINATNVSTKPARKTRAAKAMKESEDVSEETTPKRTERKKRTANKETDDKVEESGENNTIGRRKKADNKVIDQEEVIPPARSTKRTRGNAEMPGQEEPVRKSTRTRKANS